MRCVYFSPLYPFQQKKKANKNSTSKRIYVEAEKNVESSDQGDEDLVDFFDLFYDAEEVMKRDNPPKTKPKDYVKHSPVPSPKLSPLNGRYASPLSVLHTPGKFFIYLYEDTPSTYCYQTRPFLTVFFFSLLDFHLGITALALLSMAPAQNESETAEVQPSADTTKRNHQEDSVFFDFQGLLPSGSSSCSPSFSPSCSETKTTKTFLDSKKPKSTLASQGSPQEGLSRQKCLSTQQNNKAKPLDDDEKATLTHVQEDKIFSYLASKVDDDGRLVLSHGDLGKEAEWKSLGFFLAAFPSVCSLRLQGMEISKSKAKQLGQGGLQHIRSITFHGNNLGNLLVICVLFCFVFHSLCALSCHL